VRWLLLLVAFALTIAGGYALVVAVVSFIGISDSTDASEAQLALAGVLSALVGLACWVGAFLLLRRRRSGPPRA
jgi:hypothetical protein